MHYFINVFLTISGKWKKEWASSHTPRSNIAWECCMQRMAIASISDGQSVRNESHKIILAKVQKGYKLLLKKIKSAFPVKMHIYTLCTCMSFITTKFHEIPWSCFRGVVLTRKTGLTDWRTGQKNYTLRNSLRQV